MIIDTHVHVIAADTARYPLVEEARGAGRWPTETPVTVEQLLAGMDVAGVDRAVVVQAFTAYGFDNAYHADSAAAHRNRLVGVCTVDPLRDDAPDTLSYWVTERGMQGLRFSTQQGGAWLDDPRTDRLMRRVADLGIPVCVLGGQEYLGGLRALAERFPTVPLALDHIACYGTAEGLPLLALDTLLAMADVPNVLIKLSTVNLAPRGAGDEVRDAVLRRVVERFGPARVMWGTNYPVSQEGGYADMVRLGGTAMPWLSAADRDRILGGTALRLWPSLGGSGG